MREPAPSHEAPARRPEKMKTYIVARDYEDGHQLTRFVTTDCAVRTRSVAQRGAVSVEASIWIASYLLAILGLVRAAYSEQPLLWLAVWPVPVALASTIFIFVRQGFHFQSGVLVLGRRRG
jgi:hypothetical protein